MKLVVVGATGATGRRVVQVALERGHEVVAVSRRLPGEAAQSSLLVHRVADVRDSASLAAAFAGADAVVSNIGPDNNLSPGDLMSIGTANVLAACVQAQVPRFVMQSGITLTDGTDLSAGDRFALRLIQFIYRKAVADKLLAEAATQSSRLEWTIVRPAGLKDLPANGRYLAGPRARVALLKPLPFLDCADCLVCATEDEAAWRRQIVNVGLSN